MKRAEFLVIAETEAQVELGLNYALKQLEGNAYPEGEHTIPRFEIKVKWKVTNVVEASPEEPSILEAPEPVAPPVAAIEDVSLIDIDDAKGVIAVLATREELDVVESMEIGSERFPGGRKGVMQFIKQKRDELERAEAAEAKAAKVKAVKEAKEAAEAARVAAKEAKEAVKAAEAVAGADEADEKADEKED